MKSVFVATFVLALAGASALHAQSLNEWFDRAEALRAGSATPEDLARARDIHYDLLDQGYGRSLAPYAEILLAEGKPGQALGVFQAAADAGNVFAETRLAVSHLDGSFGDLSDPELGLSMLETLAEDPANVRAVLALSRALATGAGGQPAKPAAALALLERLPEDGAALARKGDLYLSGALGTVDGAQAVLAYEAAIAAGRPGVLRPLARAQVAAGQYEAALATADQALAEGDLQILRERIRWHRDGQLGAASDPVAGLADVARLEGAGLLAEGEGADIRLALARALQSEGRFAEALGALDPDHPPSVVQRVWWHRDGGLGSLSDPRQALAALDQLPLDVAEETFDVPSLRVSVAASLLDDGDPASALAAIERLVAMEDPLARYRLARWHINGALGEASAPEFGRELMRGLLAEGDVAATTYASYQLETGALGALDAEAIAVVLERAAVAGDGAATRALARAYRTHDFTDGKARHAAVLARYGDAIGPDSRVIEEVYAAYDERDHRGSRNQAAEILAAASGDGFVDGMMQLRSLERTSYLYVLQREMAALGLYRGRINGLLTNTTIQALLDLCRAEGFSETCAEGPISIPSSQAIVEAIALRRARGS
ncbi:MAG: hypothetical protein AAF871_14280 [Pseudomonadota bacterium]